MGAGVRASSVPHPKYFLAADWAKDSLKRSVYLADVSKRVVRRMTPDMPWTLGRVLALGETLSVDGPVVVGFDVPLGVPESYLVAAATQPGWDSVSTFLDLISRCVDMPEYFLSTTECTQWSLARPFFIVPKGDGGKTRYVEVARRNGVELLRGIDKRTRANSTFITAGIPGSVGSAACSLWQELAPLLGMERNFRVWPFEGELPALLEATPIVLAEIYPRAAYATALLHAKREERPRLDIAKTKGPVRCDALATFRDMPWIRKNEIRLEDLDKAQVSEDDFDALMTAAALLRCELEGVPLHEPCNDVSRSEGGILGTGSINLELDPWRFGRIESREKRIRQRPLPAVEPQLRGKTFKCPIAGCTKTYTNTRGGWDAHVGSPKNHLTWIPEVDTAEDRKKRFREEFPDFFRDERS